MNEFVINLLSNFSYLSVILAILIGCLSVVALLVYLFFWLLNVVYKISKNSSYFIHFLMHKKKFIEWHKETNPSNVFKPKLKENLRKNEEEI
ncbi:hypothetical protein D7X33_27535 [Butyricicoccus sp. 1XD8-22]|nr:hypothetical protein D7X33_27535 [Butyricicoccus sp. 1XD8-22]